MGRRRASERAAVSHRLRDGLARSSRGRRGDPIARQAGEQQGLARALAEVSPRAGGGELVELGNVSPRGGSECEQRTPAQLGDLLRAKLLHLGDVARPAVAPDKVIEPDGVNEGIAADSETHDEDPPLDNEGSELIASLLAKGLTLGVVWVANRPLAKRKPPMRGEPHEKGLEWFHDGAEYNLTKLIGKTATLGPTGKMFAGAAIICASVWMTAEPIGGAAAAAAPAQPPAPAPTAPSSTNGHTPAPAAPAALAVTSAVGVFGVEQKVSN